MSLPPINPLPGGTEIATQGEVIRVVVDPEPTASLFEAPLPRTRRIPNLGHALLFVGSTVVLLLFASITLGILSGAVPALHGHGMATRPKLQLAVQGLAYVGAVGAAWLYFPLVWRRGFLDGLRWNWSVVRRHASRLIAGGLVLGLIAALVSIFISPPKQKLGLDQFFGSTSDAWLLAFFGIFVAPVFEEICFRGFLLPGFAIAFDWLRQPRTAEARAGWESTTTLTTTSMLLSAILTSVLFAMMHFQQDAHLWPIMALLFCVSLALTVVRVMTDSVAASVVVHAAYNSFNMVALMIATGGFRHLDKMPR